MVTYPSDVTYGRPPAGLVPNLSQVESADKTLLDDLSEYSALAGRARSLVEDLMLTGHEPPKPDQTFQLPEGLNEMRPDRERLGSALDLRRILADLDQIKQDADAHDVTMFLDTFSWFVYDGMILDLSRHRTLYSYLNRIYWPISYANMERLAAFQNRVLKRWAVENRVSLIDVAGLMPRQPDLYGDAIHNTPLGTRTRAWINFQGILPTLQKDIESKAVPRPSGKSLLKHPYIDPLEYTKVFSPTIQNQ